MTFLLGFLRKKKTELIEKSNRGEHHKDDPYNFEEGRYTRDKWKEEADVIEEAISEISNRLVSTPDFPYSIRWDEILKDIMKEFHPRMVVLNDFINSYISILYKGYIYHIDNYGTLAWFTDPMGKNIHAKLSPSDTVKIIYINFYPELEKITESLKLNKADSLLPR